MSEAEGLTVEAAPPESAPPREMNGYPVEPPIKVMPDEDAAKLDLVELITKLEWRHVLNRASAPEQASKLQKIPINGEETQAYPLHLAVSLKPPTHVVEALIGAYPDAAKTREEKWGRLPLHIACINTSSAQVLKILVKQHEEALRTTDKSQGRLPLHFACLAGSPFEISVLVSAEQRALVFKDSNGKTPMDLAQESSSPHREAILRRLEDRTRIVTEAMIQRRKQQQETPPPKTEAGANHSGKVMRRRSTRSSMDSSQSKGNDTMVSEIPNMQKDRRKSVAHTPDDATVKKSNTRRGSTSSKTNGVQRFKFQSSVDDSQIGLKKRKGTRKGKRDGTKTKPPRHTSEVSPVETAVNSNVENADAPAPAAEDTPETQTPKSKNGRGSLTKFVQDNAKGTANGTKPQTNHTLQQKRAQHLSLFLSANSKEDSSDEEADNDHKSMGARSLPAMAHSSFAKPRFLQEANDSQKLAKTYMFDSSSDTSFDSPPRRTIPKPELQPQESIPESSFSGSSMMHTAELKDIETQTARLDVRRLALTQECESIYDSVARKEDDAERSRDTIINIQLQIASLQDKLQKEQAALNLSETSIQLQKETLAVHEIKIMAVDAQKSELTARTAQLREEMDSDDFLHASMN